MSDFAWLLEETLVRQHDVGFSGQLRALVLHSLALLRAHLTLYHLAPLGDVLVVPKVSVEACRELGQHSAALLPVFASEAVGGEQRGTGVPDLGPGDTAVTPLAPLCRQPAPSAPCCWRCCPSWGRPPAPPASR